MIDFNKHGIGYLKLKPTSSWSDEDFDKLFNAFISEQASPIIDFPFITENIDELLSVSSCRQCGNCCMSTNSADENPFVMADKEDIEAITQETNTDFEELTSQLTKHATSEDAWCLSLPCKFHKNGNCQVYSARPKVCYNYPLAGIVHDGISYIAINIGCEYGKDIYRCLLKGQVES